MYSRSYSSYYHTMPDGTVKQTNPFSGAEVWSVPGRGSKPISNDIPVTAQRIGSVVHPPHCIFCEGRYTSIAPEKSRLVKLNGRYEILYYLSLEQFEENVAEFRRVANMFEIVTIDYWKKNYNYKLMRSVEQWRDLYLENPQGAKHVEDIANFKMRQSGITDDHLNSKTQFDKATVIDGFFGGCHDLILGRRHYIDNAEFDTQLCSSGEFTPEEHYQYFKFTVDAMRDMLEMNRYVRYISVFQNWLKPAGASIDHLHKQICALDEWGATITNKVQMVLKDPNVFNELGANLATQHNLVFAQNDYAIAVIGIGHRFPTIEIYSKSVATRPYQHSKEELRGFSDIVHACHAAMGSQLSCNEEWFYTPVDAVYKIPWHVELKWRVNVPAGFEGGTGIYINPVLPTDFRDKIVQRLFDLRNQGKISNISIADGYTMMPNPLQYCAK